MTKRGESVSIRVHPTIKIVIDLISAQHRATTRKGLTNDEVLWELMKSGAPNEVKRALAMGAEEPKDKRSDKDSKSKEQ